MISLRTCVACRQRATRDALLRIVAHEGSLLSDECAIPPGRGAWVHPVAECLQQALSRKLFVRALKVSTRLDVSPLENRLEKPMDN